jgi:hypothetical protein
MATQTGRSAAAQLRELGHTVHGEDHPRWHLTTAEEAMDEGQWDTARVAVQRARENMVQGGPDAVEARFVALRLAVSTIDLRAATEETMALVECMDEHDPVWNRRVRDIIAAAPRVFSGSMRTGLTSILPPLPQMVGGGVAGTGAGADREPELFADAGIASVGVDADPRQDGPPLPEYEVWLDDGDPNSEPEATADQPDSDPRWNVRVDPAVHDVEDADALRDHLVERMLADVSDDEFQLLFETATTFLANRQYDTAELMFSAAMQAPGLRVAACEGLVQSLALGGRHSEAIAAAARAARVFAREGAMLAGIVYWQGVAAQDSGDVAMARGCFDRVLATPAASVFPELRSRRESAGP